jgi:hypothetical protein
MGVTPSVTKEGESHIVGGPNRSALAYVQWSTRRTKEEPKTNDDLPRREGQTLF